MKSIKEINDLLGLFEKKFGYQIGGAQQQSEAWFNAKLGVLSSSHAHQIVSKKGSETRMTYLATLCAQVCTGLHHEIKAIAMDWGNQNEDKARSYYEFSSGLTITQLPFVFKDDTYREGCSPDGLVNDRKGVEIKAPFDSANYVKFFCGESIKSEWRWQQQYTMRILDAEQWDLCQYDERMKKNPMKILTVDRDEAMQKTFDDAVPAFIEDMDKMLAQIGIPFGHQWHRLITKI